MYAEDPKNKEEARKEAKVNSTSGITGVPYFFVNGEPIGSGAQPSNVFVGILEKAEYF